MTRPAPDWFADDAFWEAMYPYLSSEAARAAALTDVAAIRALAGRPVTTILDLCCGSGRYSVASAKQGCRVTGVDRSPFLLDRARQCALEEDVHVRWVQEDMRDFTEPGSFDCAINLFTSFGDFDDPADNRRVLANVHASLVPGGVLVLDLVGKKVAACLYQP